MAPCSPSLVSSWACSLSHQAERGRPQLPCLAPPLSSTRARSGPTWLLTCQVAGDRRTSPGSAAHPVPSGRPFLQPQSPSSRPLLPCFCSSRRPLHQTAPAGGLSGRSRTPAQPLRPHQLWPGLSQRCVLAPDARFLAALVHHPHPVSAPFDPVWTAALCAYLSCRGLH